MIYEVDNLPENGVHLSQIRNEKFTILMCQARNFSPGYFLNVISHWPRDFSTCRKCRRWGSSPRCLVGSTQHTMPLLCPLCEGKRGVLISLPLCWSQDGLEPTAYQTLATGKESFAPGGGEEGEDTPFLRSLHPSCDPFVSSTFYWI